MDLSKAFSISTDYKDRKCTPDWEMHSFSEIVFIDKPHSGAAPLLYQLKDPTLSLRDADYWKSSSFSFSRDTFFLVGEIASIDRKHKKIYLANRNSVSYNYLVMASGSKPLLSITEIEFAAGLQALIDALKVKPKIPNSFAAYINSANPAALESSRSTNSSSTDSSPDNTGNVAQSSIASANKGKEFEFNSINKRLYEVQL